MRFMRWAGAMLLLASLFTLNACGFKLRGKADFSFQTMQLVAGNSSALSQELKRVLRANGITVTTDSTPSDVQLTVLGEAVQRNILTFNASGSAREIELRYILTFQLKDNAGKFLIAPSQVNVKRDITYTDDQILAKQAEEQLLITDMRSDVVQQLIRRLTVVKPNKTIGLEPGPQ